MIKWPFTNCSTLMIVGKPDAKIQHPICFDICDMLSCGDVADWFGRRERD